jgi:hypothetical protein
MCWPSSGRCLALILRMPPRMPPGPLAARCRAAGTASKPFSMGGSGFRGVCWHQRRGKWRAALRVSGPQVFLGYFADEWAAALAHDAAARLVHGRSVQLFTCTDAAPRPTTLHCTAARPGSTCQMSRVCAGVSAQVPAGPQVQVLTLLPCRAASTCGFGASAAGTGGCKAQQVRERAAIRHTQTHPPNAS